VKSPTTSREDWQILFLFTRSAEYGKPTRELDSQERRQFYVQLAESFLEKDWWNCGSWNERTAAAAQSCFRFGDTVYILQEGFDPGFAADKVGYALRAAMLQHFIAAGIKRYDFLGGLATQAQNGVRCRRLLELAFCKARSLGSCYLSFADFADQSKQAQK